MTDPLPPRDSLLAPDDNRLMFDRIAARYDLLNAVLSLGLHRRWRRLAIAALAPQPNGRYLDVGAGTGDLSLELLRVCPSSRLVALDPAAHMLLLAHVKLTRAGFPPSSSTASSAPSAPSTAPSSSPTACGFASLSSPPDPSLRDSASFPPILLVTGASDPTLPSRSFEGFVSAFVLRNIADRSTALTNLRRLLVPGGRAVFLDLTIPASPLLRLSHRLYTRLLFPPLGRLLSGSAAAYRYLADSVQHFPPAAEILSSLAAAGFVNPRAVPLSGGLVTLFLASA